MGQRVRLLDTLTSDEFHEYATGRLWKVRGQWARATGTVPCPACATGQLTVDPFATQGPAEAPVNAAGCNECEYVHVF